MVDLAQQQWVPVSGYVPRAADRWQVTLTLDGLVQEATPDGFDAPGPYILHGFILSLAQTTFTANVRVPTLDDIELGIEVAGSDISLLGSKRSVGTQNARDFIAAPAWDVNSALIQRVIEGSRPQLSMRARWRHTVTNPASVQSAQLAVVALTSYVGREQ